MLSERPLRRFEDILENIARMERFTAGMDFASFAANELAAFASLHALLIVSEAARKLGGTAEALVPSQPWHAIRGIGNIPRHEYDGVDPATVWRIVASGDLTTLKTDVTATVARLRAEPAP